MEKDNEARLTFETYKEQIDTWYRAHNIIREKSELYYDFLSSLLDLIDETYLGSDVLVSDDDIINHFNWCFNKITNNFEQERIHFIVKSNHYEYLWSLLYKGYYKSFNEQKYRILSEYFKELFIFNKLKKPLELESFIEIYKIFDQNLKKIN
jgi:adenosine deaminase